MFFHKKWDETYSFEVNDRMSIVFQNFTFLFAIFAKYLLRQFSIWMANLMHVVCSGV